MPPPFPKHLHLITPRTLARLPRLNATSSASCLLGRKPKCPWRGIGLGSWGPLLVHVRPTCPRGSVLAALLTEDTLSSKVGENGRAPPSMPSTSRASPQVSATQKNVVLYCGHHHANDKSVPTYRAPTSLQLDTSSGLSAILPSRSTGDANF